jgi:hypothetical protein
MSNIERTESFDMWSWASTCTPFRTATYAAVGASVLGLDVLTNSNADESLELTGAIGLTGLAIVSAKRAFDDYRRTKAEIEAQSLPGENTEL